MRMTPKREIARPNNTRSRGGLPRIGRSFNGFFPEGGISWRKHSTLFIIERFHLLFSALNQDVGLNVFGKRARGTLLEISF
jgi:hypothetical protein